MLGGPRDLFANGIHLNVIQAAEDPAEESWRNINAIDDLVQAILTTTGQLTVAALAGNAAAGGPDARAGRRPGLVPGRRGPQSALPADGPARLGILDLHPAPPRRRAGGGPAHRRVPARHPRLRPANRPDRPGHRRRPGRATARRWRPWPSSWPPAPITQRGWPPRRGELAAAEKQRPLAAYRAAELAIMSRNFSGPGEPYAQLRRAFVYKEKPARTPPHLTRHRTDPGPGRPGHSRQPRPGPDLDLRGRSPPLLGARASPAMSVSIRAASSAARRSVRLSLAAGGRLLPAVLREPADDVTDPSGQGRLPQVLRHLTRRPARRGRRTRCRLRAGAFGRGLCGASASSAAWRSGRSGLRQDERRAGQRHEHVPAAAAKPAASRPVIRAVPASPAMTTSMPREPCSSRPLITSSRHQVRTRTRCAAAGSERPR